VILWPKTHYSYIQYALQDKNSVYVVRGVKCWLNMRHCRWNIIELLINTLMLSVGFPFVIFLLVIVVSNSTPTSWWVTNIFLTHDDQYLYSELMMTHNSTRSSWLIITLPITHINLSICYCLNNDKRIRHKFFDLVLSSPYTNNVQYTI
jgi:hypothetical protein